MGAFTVCLVVPSLAIALVSDCSGFSRQAAATPATAAPTMRPNLVAPPPGALTGRPSMPIAPWPTLPSASHSTVATTQPSREISPDPLAAEAPEQRRIRLALDGEWRWATTTVTAEGGNESNECRLVVTGSGARETCTRSTSLGPEQSWPCGTDRAPHVRSTSSPYDITITDGELLFMPGVASLISDNGCERPAAERHTVMRARWDGTSTDIVMTTSTTNGTDTATYSRVN